MSDVSRERERRLDRLAEEQAALRRVATQVAQGVSAGDLFSAVSDEVGRLFGAEAAIARFESDGSAMEVVGLTKGIPVVTVGTRWELEDYLASTAVYRTGRPARNDHTGYADAQGEVADSLRQMGAVSTVAAPILVEGHVWGVMTVSHHLRMLPPDTEERMVRFTELVATAIANADSRISLAQLVEEQAALRRVATLVAQGVSPAELFEAVSAEVALLFDAEAGVARFEPDGSALVFVGLSDGIRGVSVGSRWALEPFLASSKVFYTQRPARSERSAMYDASEPIANALRENDLRTIVSAPIIAGSGPWGVIAVAETRNVLPRDTEDRLEKFTGLLATAIVNADARAELSTLAEEQVALRRVATLVATGATPSEVFSVVSNEVGRLFGSDQAAIGRYEPDGSAVVFVGISEGLSTMPVGTRWPLEGFLASTTVYRTGLPARQDESDYEGSAGPVADTLRELQVLTRVGAPIVVEGSLWGVLLVTGTRERLPPGAERQLAKFTELVATAIANAESRGELAASRARIVEAGDDARRRIERDLHDGAQQRLVTLAVALRRAEAKIPPGLEVKAEITRVGDSLMRAVDELRELSHGIHPSILTEGGLSPALKALARRSTVRVKLDLTVQHRLPDNVEVAAYYTVSEALTNASKHSNATRVSISVHVEDDMLSVSILDDGSGGADPQRGSGLTGLRDRIEALGGTIHIESPTGIGTSLQVKIPIHGSFDRGIR